MQGTDDTYWPFSACINYILWLQELLEEARSRMSESEQAAEAAKTDVRTDSLYTL